MHLKIEASFSVDSDKTVHQFDYFDGEYDNLQADANKKEEEAARDPPRSASQAATVNSKPISSKSLCRHERPDGQP